METLDLDRICALRMRAIMSPIGSFTAIAAPLPARLHKTRNQAFRTELAQRDTAEFVLTIVRARPARQLAAIADASLRRIARHFGKLKGGGKTVLHRQLLVMHDRFELGATIVVLLRQLAPSLILLDRTLLSHSLRSLRIRV